MEPTCSSSVAELAKYSEDNVETDESKVVEHQEYAEALSMSGESRKRKRWTRRSCCTRQVLSTGAIFIALLLIIGAIYMHLRQKHHLGRLHINLKDRGQVEVLEEDFPMVTVAGVDAQTPTITKFQPPPTSSPEPSAKCLACMATTATDNIPAICRNRGRPEEPCGIYRISHVYWQDALRIIDPDDSLAQDYGRCVVDVQCAERIVRSYVQRYGGEDCNGDGRIECRDHVRLHMRGPGGCHRQEPLGSLAERRLENCLKYRGIT
ncbi:uncharacterized protein LOC6737078 isoform X1 [Drosophila simulans]|uniref:lysozyme n=1 Tax=Drosophila simulans TaxID=7240 RepID=B4QJW9_DROSI|nr:uncharacterized protein LOC6737078 isoform X1 [Drosophila simulans]EDX09510.1 GD13989 [Drosophila simulans]KMY98008.1 uncharacterized protein Dsimw501_GD13989, isoform A [Drosophila simulans]